MSDRITTIRCAVKLQHTSKFDRIYSFHLLGYGCDIRTVLELLGHQNQQRESKQVFNRWVEHLPRRSRKGGKCDLLRFSVTQRWFTLVKGYSASVDGCVRPTSQPSLKVLKGYNFSYFQLTNRRHDRLDRPTPTSCQGIVPQRNRRPFRGH